VIATHANAHGARRRAIEMIYRGKASHLGTSMSVIEILTAVYESVDIAKIAAQAPDRSRLIVSKGHSAAATYSVMAQFGLLSEAVVATYHTNDSLLSGHVSHAVRGVEHSTGALGHGLPVAVGIALGLRSHGYHDARVFVVLGDGELQEGSNWEAIMLAHHLKLANLVILLDNNGISSITKTSYVVDMTPYRQRFAGFGLEVREVDGHSVPAIRGAIEDLRGSGLPGAIVCNTVKGRGVPFAEGDPIWHYRSLNESLYKTAIADLEARY